MGISLKGILALCGVLWAIALPALAEDDPAYLVIGSGSWETLRDKDRAGEIDLAYRSDLHLWFLRPHAGVVIATDGDYYGYAGLLTDIDLTSHVVATVTAAIGGYGGHGFNLGSHFEFRTGGDLAWRFDNRSRLGVGFYHISNAGLTRENGGSESLLLMYSHPLY